MDIFESLENLNVSEECFNDIMGIVEGRVDDYYDRKFKSAEYEYEKEKDPKKKEELYAKLNNIAGKKLDREYNKHASEIPAKDSIGTGNGSRMRMGHQAGYQAGY